jgi:thiamine biosynthesis lipoprotein
MPTQAIRPLTAVEWDERQTSIRLPVGSGLDLGGVAKGWAAHTAMRKLQAYGPALVEAGGDIAISGQRADGEAWEIGVANPFAPDENLIVLQVGRCGIATENAGAGKRMGVGCITSSIHAAGSRQRRMC